MGLRDFKPPTKTVSLGEGNALTVRALGFDDIQFFIVHRHGLITAALEFLDETGNVDPSAVDQEALKSAGAVLLAKMPLLVAELIAIAADEPESADAALELSAPLQLELLMSIYEMTFTEPDSLKKFFDHLTRLIQGIPRPTTMVKSGSHGSAGSGVTLNS